MASSSPSRTPVLLLKTISTPGDAYEDLFSAADNGRFAPRFVPVLQHRFEDAGMNTLRGLLREKRISHESDAAYGGLIFTSQRAVEAFAKLVQDDAPQENASWPHLPDIPIYSVGPATTRALRSIPQSPPLQVFGEHTGNGEALAKYILEHYTQWYPDRNPKPPLLFPVGEQRRDIIPKTLMDTTLPDDRQIKVDEEVVYGTGVMESFPNDFAQILDETKDLPERWVVVFSPTGCDSMLSGLGLLDPKTGRAIDFLADKRDGKTFIVTIGPTTQSYLRDTFGFEPDVCADKPSPEGVLQAIIDFQSKTKSTCPKEPPLWRPRLSP